MPVLWRALLRPDDVAMEHLELLGKHLLTAVHAQLQLNEAELNLMCQLTETGVELGNMELEVAEAVAEMRMGCFGELGSPVAMEAGNGRLRLQMGGVLADVGRLVLLQALP